MSLKYLPLVGALAIAGQAGAKTINMTDFQFGPPVTVDMTNTAEGPSYDGIAGAFQGDEVAVPVVGALLRSSVALSAVDPASFTAWCAELTQSFSFGVTYDYTQVSGTSYFTGQKAADLSRLFTATHGIVFDSSTSAAMQAGIWEIIYEKGTAYGFATGNFTGVPEKAGDQAAFDTINGYLTHLSDYKADYRIDVLTNGDHQDFLVATIPEPETWALLVAGLGVLGLLKRRRRA